MRKIVLIVIVAFIVLACAEDEIVEQEKYTIKFGSECGWCAGQEYITLTSNKIEYLRNIPCGDDKGKTEKSRDLTSEEWEMLTNSFDYSLFLTLDYSECNVCVDGCDEIIKITEDDEFHELRYSYSDEVEGMENLRQKLTEIMDEMREL